MQFAVKILHMSYKVYFSIKEKYCKTHTEMPKNVFNEINKTLYISAAAKCISVNNTLLSKSFKYVHSL